MANYYCTIKTNYFHVKDDASFREMMTHVYDDEGSIEVWEGTDTDGRTVFGFGACGEISGLMEDGADEPSYDDLIARLQELVAEDDAIIILEVGGEKMCYVVGAATIITSKECKWMRLDELASEQASKMLGDPLWKTRCEY